MVSRASATSAAAERRRGGDELGLVDGLGDLRTIVRRKYGPDVRFFNIERPAGWLQRRFGRYFPSDVVHGVGRDDGIVRHISTSGRTTFAHGHPIAFIGAAILGILGFGS